MVYSLCIALCAPPPLHLGLIGSPEFAGEPQAVFAFLDTGVGRQELWAVS